MKKPQGTRPLRRLREDVWGDSGSASHQLQDLQAAAEAPHFPQHLPFEQAEQWALLHLACVCDPAVQDEQEEPLGQAQFARNRALAARMREVMVRFMGGWKK
jgi:hypothetical protein